MNSRPAVAFAASTLLLLQTGCASIMTTPPKPSKFAAFVESLLLDAGSSGQMLHWSWANAAGARVSWSTTEPVKPSKRAVWLARSGPVQLPVDRGDRSPEEVPDSWHVKLSGPEAGIKTVSIENMGDSHALCPLATYYVESLANHLDVAPYRCKNEGASFGQPIYSVGKKGKKTAWIINEYSGGSGGCMLTLYLVYDVSATNEVKCRDE